MGELYLLVFFRSIIIMNEMPETITGGMPSEEVLNFSPFVSILMIDYLKTKYQNKPDDTIKQYIEYILADANTYTTSSSTISVSPEELINRCDAVIVKLEKQCDGTHVMMLIQKMLELINKRLNNE